MYFWKAIFFINYSTIFLLQSICENQWLQIKIEAG